MATREQILGMFGATPDQIAARERQRKADFFASQRTNEQSLGSGLAMAAQSLFGKPSQEMQMAQQMQGVMQGIDPNDATQLRALAKTVAEFAPERALQIARYANELEKQTTGERVNLPTIVGYKPIYKFNSVTGKFVEVGKEAVYKEVPHTNEDGEWTPIIDYGQSNAEGTPKEETPTSNSPYIYNPNSRDVDDNPDYDPTKPTTPSMLPYGLTSPSSVPNIEQPSVPAQSQGGFDPGVAVPMTGIPGQTPSTGPQRTGNFIPEDTGIPAPIPTIEGQVTFADPNELKAVSDELRDQITALSNSDDPEKDAKIAALKKKRAQVSKLILGSRRQLVSKNPFGGTR